MGRSNQAWRVAAGAALAWLVLLSGCSEAPESSSGDLGSPTSDVLPQPRVAEDVVVVATPTPDGPRPLIVATVFGEGEAGVMGPLDRPALAGVLAEVERLNEQGGVLGRPVEVRRFDHESRVSVVERIGDRLVEERPDVIIVTCDVAFAKPLLEAADAAGLVTISPCADDDGYATGAWGPGNFTLGAPAETRGALAAAAAVERYGSTAMVLRDVTSPEALGFCDGFEPAFRDLGGRIVYSDRFSYDTLEPVQDRLSERGAQTAFIVLCSHVPGGVDAAPSIISMLRTLGFGAPVVSGTGVDEPTWFQAVPVLGDLLFVSWSSIHGNDPDERVNEIIRRADANSESPPAGVTTVLGAEAIEAWARAVEAVRSAEAGPVAASLGSFNNEAFSTGDLSFVAGARMDLTRLYRVLQVSEGVVRVVGVLESES